jgi:hypothetical protein
MTEHEYEHFARLHEHLLNARAALDNLRSAIRDELRGAAPAQAKLYQCERDARQEVLEIWRRIDRLERFRDHSG